MINLNGSNIGEMYYGSTKIGEAYLGSDLVYGRKYSETLLWSGNTTAKNTQLNLSQHPSAFDSIKIMTWGQNNFNNNINPTPIYTDWNQLSSQNRQFICNGFWGAASTGGVTTGYWFFGTLIGCSSQQWTLANAYGRYWNTTTGGAERYDFTQVREIWGIKYGL